MNGGRWIANEFREDMRIKQEVTNEPKAHSKLLEITESRSINPAFTLWIFLLWLLDMLLLRMLGFKKSHFVPHGGIIVVLMEFLTPSWRNLFWHIPLNAYVLMKCIWGIMQLAYKGMTKLWICIFFWETLRITLNLRLTPPFIMITPFLALKGLFNKVQTIRLK